MTTEAMLRELELSIARIKGVIGKDDDVTYEQAAYLAYSFIRDHGHFLAKMVVDSERIQWLQDTYNQVSPQFLPRPKGYTGTLEPTGQWGISVRGTRSGFVANSLREAIDRARGIG